MRFILLLVYTNIFTCLKGVEMFANPNFREFHLKFWYKTGLSPIRRGNLPWVTTPLRMLASSATAVSVRFFYTVPGGTHGITAGLCPPPRGDRD